MPASQKAIYQQFEVSAKPAWWLRRWTRFPLFFQATHPRFYLIVKRISDGEPNGKTLDFYIQFADGARVDFPVDVSQLQTGKSLKCKTKKILLSHTGDTRICLDRTRKFAAPASSFDTLYAFVVNAEATLVFLLLNLVLGGILALLLRLNAS